MKQDNFVNCLEVCQAKRKIYCMLIYTHPDSHTHTLAHKDTITHKDTSCSAQCQSWPETEMHCAMSIGSSRCWCHKVCVCVPLGLCVCVWGCVCLFDCVSMCGYLTWSTFYCWQDTFQLASVTVAQVPHLTCHHQAHMQRAALHVRHPLTLSKWRNKHG